MIVYGVFYIIIVEVFCNCQIGECYMGMCVWRFVYLIKYEGCFRIFQFFYIYVIEVLVVFFYRFYEVFVVFDNVCFKYFLYQVVVFMGMFVYICEYRDIIVFFCDVVDQFLNEYGFIYICIIKEANFFIFQVRFDQVDYFDIGVEYFFFYGEVFVDRWFVVNRS